MKKDFFRCLAVTLLVLAVSGMSVGIGMAQGNDRAAVRETEEATEKAPDIVVNGQSYAYVELKHAGFPLLVVTDGTYGYNGLEASFYGEVYGQDGEGNWKKMQVIAGSGTAYPIRYDKNGIYVTGGHFAAYYGVDWEKAITGIWWRCMTGMRRGSWWGSGKWNRRWQTPPTSWSSDSAA